MKSSLRTVIFWIHLSAGLIAGLVVAIMAVTGAALAFEPQILDRAERASRQVHPPDPSSARLPLDELLARARKERPGMRATTVTIHADSTAAVRVSAGRDGGVHVDPYTGEVRDLAGRRWRDFLRLATDWHRWLGADGEGRVVGRAVTGACNAAFLFLAVSGLFLWWPRRWTRRTLGLSIWFGRGLTSKVRDWNWHNVIGFWSLPVLIVVTGSGMVISYRWAANLVFRLAGERPPLAQGPPGRELPTVRPAPGTAQALPVDALVAVARGQVPTWQTIMLRLRPEGAGEPRGRERDGEAPAVSFSIKEPSPHPRFASTRLLLDPFTGRILRRETFADSSPGQRARSWLRHLHTGEALGWPGQLAAAVASLGATLLVWTGFALACRRFLRHRRARNAAAAPTAQA